MKNRTHLKINRDRETNFAAGNLIYFEMGSNNFFYALLFLFAAFFVIRFEYAHVPKSLEFSEKTSYTGRIHMQIESASFKNNGTIPARHTCDGASTNPPLTFINVPTGAKSLVLIIEDPDVPRSIRADGMFDHLVMWGIDPATRAIEEGLLPAGFLGKATNGAEGYVGPCPPDGEHRYFFRAYALDAEVSLPPGSTKGQLLRAMAGHIIEEANLIGMYNRAYKQQ